MIAIVALDPVIHVSVRAALGLLFLSAALHKLRDVGAYRRAVVDYRLLPKNLCNAAVVMLIGAELGIAAALVATPTSEAALAAALLLALYTGAIAANLIRGRRDIDCGCAGPARRQRLSGGLISRNVGLIVAAMLVALPCSPRSLTWIDGVTIVTTITFLSLLYGAIDELVRNSKTGILSSGGAAAQALEPPGPQAPAARPGGAA